MKASSHWEKVGFYPHHGIAFPLSALRSKKSCGIGEFLDLLPLIDWCKKNGFDCLELLPINDTENDPSPYNPISSCALDPIYLSLYELAKDRDLSIFIPLNELPRLDRKAVKEEKMKWLRHFFSSFKPDDNYQKFLADNSWLIPYAQFKVLTQKHNTTDWKTWAKNEKIGQKELDFYCYLQYLCFSQFKQVKRHAETQGVFLKGDIPILLSPCSVDVWTNPNFFDLTLTAGAPPDYYTPSGQNWGFPLFNWDEMRKTHFAWWKQRLKTASELYHLYRIDHVVGFFRIWSIPLGASPLEGSFVPKERSVWKKHGEEILEMMLEATSMLPIAEDLGTIPDEVYPCLKNLGICGTKVMRWEKRKNGSYIPGNEYEPLSMTTVSTWDCDTIKGWWKNFPNEAQEFAHFKHWNYTAELSYKELFTILRDSHHTPSYFHINLLQEYLSLFPELVWGSPEDERINIPGTLLSTNWTYRFRSYLEELVVHKGLAEAVQGLLKKETVSH